LADLDLCGCHRRIWAPVPLQWVEWRVDLRLVVTIMDTRRRLVISVITRKSSATLHTHVVSPYHLGICMLMNRSMCSTERLLLIPQDRQVEINRSHPRPRVRWYASCQWIFFWHNLQWRALWFWLFPIASIPFLDIAQHDYEPAQSSIIRCAPCCYECVR
jgi:hypothetical protein